MSDDCPLSMELKVEVKDLAKINIRNWVENSKTKESNEDLWSNILLSGQ